MAVRSTLPRLGRLLGRTRFAASILPIRRCAGGSSGYESSEEEDNVTELTRHKWDVTISGAGLAGAALACALGTADAFEGKRVLLLERRNIRSDHDEEKWSNRVYALTPGSKDFLQGLGVWDLLPKAKIQVINRMKVND